MQLDTTDLYDKQVFSSARAKESGGLDGANHYVPAFEKEKPGPSIEEEPGPFVRQLPS